VLDSQGEWGFLSPKPVFSRVITRQTKTEQKKKAVYVYVYEHTYYYLYLYIDIYKEGTQTPKAPAKSSTYAVLIRVRPVKRWTAKK